MRCWLLLLIVSLQCWLGAEPLHFLFRYADGLNVEGGEIARTHLREGQLWANLCFVLDRPFYTEVDLDELTAANPFPLKEASLLEFNEHRALFATLSVIEYYREHVHALCGLASDEVARIVVQVHRNSSGPKHIELLREFLPPCSFCEVDWRFGACQFGGYDEVNIVISVSMVAGLHPDWGSGELLVPSYFIPFDIAEAVLREEGAYMVRNHLLEVLDDLVEEQSASLLERVNAFFVSSNPEKCAERATWLMQEEFHPCTLLHANAYFYPKKMASEFRT